MTIEEINKRIAKLLALDVKNSEKLLDDYGNNIIKAYGEALDEIKKLIAEMFEKYGDGVTFADMMKYNRLKNLEQEIYKQVKLLTNKNIGSIEKMINNFFSEIYYRTGYAYETSIGARLGFGLLDPNVISAIMINPFDRIKWHDRMKSNAQEFAHKLSIELRSNLHQEQQRQKLKEEQLRKILAKGTIQGKGYGKMAADFSDITKTDVYKSLRIVRTETHRAQSAARLLAYQKTKKAADRLGIGINRIWVSTLDDRTRDSHRYMDGKESDPETGLFTFETGETTEGPGLSGIASQDIQCRCSDITKLKGFDPKFRRENISNEVISNITYEEWAKMKEIAA